MLPTRVLVTGGAGQLGSAVVGAFARHGYDVSSRTKRELDTAEARACIRSVRRLRPDIVVDCSGPAPDDPVPTDNYERARRGAGNLARATRELGALIVHTSCAEVFDGTSEAPYLESHPPRPASPFGTAKLDAERIVASSNHRHMIVRSSWLFSARPHSFAERMLADAARGEVLEVDVELRSVPTYTQHLVEGIVGLVRRRSFGIFHVAAQGSCTRMQFARALLRGVHSDVRVVPALDRPVSAPGGSLILGTRRPETPLLPAWQLGLHAFLHDRQPADRPRSGNGRRPPGPFGA